MPPTHGRDGPPSWEKPKYFVVDLAYLRILSVTSDGAKAAAQCAVLNKFKKQNANYRFATVLMTPSQVREWHKRDNTDKYGELATFIICYVILFALVGAGVAYAFGAYTLADINAALEVVRDWLTWAKGIVLNSA